MYDCTIINAAPGATPVTLIQSVLSDVRGDLVDPYQMLYGHLAARALASQVYPKDQIYFDPEKNTLFKVEKKNPFSKPSVEMLNPDSVRQELQASVQQANLGDVVKALYQAKYNS